MDDVTTKTNTNANANTISFTRILDIVGIIAFCFTLFYGGAGWGTLLLCLGLMMGLEFWFRFRENLFLTPYRLMLLSPLLLIKYSSITDFRIRTLSFFFLVYVFNVALKKSKREWRFSLSNAKPFQVWLTAFLIFALVSTFLFYKGLHLSGDEPHYLMISQSLTDDGDFDLKNNFQDKTYYAFLPIDLRFHGGEYDGKMLSFHLPGVSFLLVPFYWLYKVMGAPLPPALFFRLAAAVINAFFALCLFYLLKMTFPGKEVTKFWLFMLAVFPLVFHGVHLYPELPGATLMMAGVLFALGEKKNYWLAGVFLALVPWFHVKYIPALGILGLAIVYDILKPLKPFKLDKEKTKRLLVLFSVPLISMVLLVIYSKTLYGSYSPTNIFPKESYWSVPWLLRLKVFLAYFLDQRDGLLFYSPLFFLFFFSFKNRMSGSNRKTMSNTAPVHPVASMVPNKYLFLSIAFVYIFFHAFTTVRGAYSPAGRPLMFVSWVFILFLGHFYFNLPDEREFSGRRFIYRLLAGLGVFVTIWLFYYPLFIYQPVFAGTVERPSGLNLFLGGDFVHLWDLFPSFLTSPKSGHPANLVWVGLLIVLLLVFYLKPFRRNKSTKTSEGRFDSKKILVPLTLMLFLGVAFLYSFYPHVHLIPKNKHTDKVISFYNNSRNFRYVEEQEGFRIKPGNAYDIFIDLKMVMEKEVTFRFTHTDVNRVVCRNGKRLLFSSNGKKQSEFNLNLLSLKALWVGNKKVAHIGFETTASTDNSYLWLEIR